MLAFFEVIHGRFARGPHQSPVVWRDHRACALNEGTCTAVAISHWRVLNKPAEELLVKTVLEIAEHVAAETGTGSWTMVEIEF